ncbi:hypothetical protein X777_09330 [Ooceraea biroi]|uniref:Uncharacterized protein n=1 Tax=Ooceraea biroi TaxID=2015173 RepID=A0A026X2U8_OOCBI|nr:hypothetical protein X777_09330 [Ooceraea biroi]
MHISKAGDTMVGNRQQEQEITNRVARFGHLYSFLLAVCNRLNMLPTKLFIS